MAEALKPPFWRDTGAGKAFMHPCAVCGDEHAPFGYGVRFVKGEPGVWFCGKHKGQADGYASGEAKQESAVGRADARIENAAASLPELGEAGPHDTGTGGPQGSLFD